MHGANAIVRLRLHCFSNCYILHSTSKIWTLHCVIFQTLNLEFRSQLWLFAMVVTVSLWTFQDTCGNPRKGIPLSISIAEKTEVQFWNSPWLDLRRMIYMSQLNLKSVASLCRSNLHWTKIARRLGGSRDEVLRKHMLTMITTLIFRMRKLSLRTVFWPWQCLPNRRHRLFLLRFSSERYRSKCGRRRREVNPRNWPSLCIHLGCVTVRLLGTLATFT